LKIGNSRWSAPCDFYVDLPPGASEIRVRALQDGVSWREAQIDWNNGGWITLWVTGLTAEADAGNVVVEIGGVPHLPVAVTDVQINVQLRPLIGPGEHRLRILHRGSESQPVSLVVTGSPPPIRGLERLTGR
jgi:hypothetical protein